jgi:branched-chain amino acid transport system substrate-binding protein
MAVYRAADSVLTGAWIGSRPEIGIGLRSLAALLICGWLAGCSTGTPKVDLPPPLPQPQPEIQAPVTPAPATPVPLPTRQADGSVRVALLLPLTGRGAATGQGMLDAAQLALFDVADDRFVLVLRDTQGTPEGAVAAAQDALSAGVSLILGPLFGPDAQAVRPLALQAGIPVLSFSSDWTVAGPGLWAIGFQPHDQVNRIISFAASRGITRFGLLTPETGYGQTVAAATEAAVQRAGGTVTAHSRFTTGTTNLTTLVKEFSAFDSRHARLLQERAHLAAASDEASKQALARLSNQETFGEPPFDAVMLPEGGQTLREVAALLPFFDIDPGPVRFLGTGLWDEPGLGREPALLGGWFAAPAPELRQAFELRFQTLYGSRPPRLATLAYDATALAAALARSDDPTPFEPADLMNVNGFSGLDGIFRLLPEGRSERGLAVLEVTRTGTVTIDPAPPSFVPPPGS